MLELARGFVEAAIFDDRALPGSRLVAVGVVEEGTRGEEGVARTWKDIERFYQKLETDHGFVGAAPMRQLVNALQEVPELESITPFTSHQFLCLSTEPGYPGWFEHDLVAVYTYDSLFFTVRIQAPVGVGRTSERLVRATRIVDEIRALAVQLRRARNTP